jgi:uncharacterized protein YjbI with pentapeptide repeats
MDRDEAIRLLKGGEEGIAEWNRRREEGEEIPLLVEFDVRQADLGRANLRWANLSRANLWGANLCQANLSNADLIQANAHWAKFDRANFIGADLRGAYLGGALLSEAKLRGTNLVGAKLRRAKVTGAEFGTAGFAPEIDDKKGTRLVPAFPADLSGADLGGADLSNASFNETNLSGADLTEANLCGARFNRPNLSAANFSRALFDRTEFVNVDLSEGSGLDTCMHYGPSTIGTDTLLRSKGKIPRAFLLGCGVPESLIEYLPSLIVSMNPIQFYSCFISYSHKDEDFATGLHSRMTQEKLRVWYAPKDIQGGKKLHE